MQFEKSIKKQFYPDRYTSLLPREYTANWFILLVLLTVTLVFGAIIVSQAISLSDDTITVYQLKTSEKPLSVLIPCDFEAVPSSLKPIGNRLVTAYSPSPDETQGDPCIGAYGQNICDMLRNCIRSVATNEFPAGSKLIIAGKVYTVADTVPYADKRLDIFVSTKDEAIDWGVRTLPISIIK